MTAVSRSSGPKGFGLRLSLSGTRCERTPVCGVCSLCSDTLRCCSQHSGYRGFAAQASPCSPSTAKEHSGSCQGASAAHSEPTLRGQQLPGQGVQTGFVGYCFSVRICSPSHTCGPVSLPSCHGPLGTG